MKKNITRRDFLNGSALAVGALGLSSTTALGQLLGAGGEKGVSVPLPADYYPPTLTGLRGSHKGSYEVAHSLAWRGQKPQHYQQLQEDYDLVIVGGGVSGLSAAWFYRKQMGHDARILILDNHDDFGGHAKRNEFQVNGKTLLGAGGSQNLQFPDRYDDISRSLLDDLGIDTDAMESNMAQDYPLGNTDHDAGMSFATENGHVNLGGNWVNFLHAKGDYRKAIGQLPFDQSEKDKLIEFVSGEYDYLDELSYLEKYEYSKTTSYNSFLHDKVGFSDRTISMLDVFSRGMFGFSGWKDSAHHAIMFGAPGLRAMGWLGEAADFLAMNTGRAYDARYFPDGNATVARLLVSKLIPAVAKGGADFTNVATKRFDYSQLDQVQHPTKVRLNSTAVGVRQRGEDQVEIDYVISGQAQRVTAKRCILACYNGLIPHLCPELPDKQKENLSYGVKIPLVFTTVALKDGKAWSQLGCNMIFCPHDYFNGITIAPPSTTGGHQPPMTPEDPMTVTMFHSPAPEPTNNETGRELFRRGRHILYSTPYEVYEKNIRQQLQSVLGQYGFDHERDIEAITVNRWSHGYSYPYMPLDDPEWEEGQAPHELGRKQFGRISIANSDSEAVSLITAAIIAAHRAVQEQVSS